MNESITNGMIESYGENIMSYEVFTVGELLNESVETDIKDLVDSLEYDSAIEISLGKISKSGKSAHLYIDKSDKRHLVKVLSKSRKYKGYEITFMDAGDVNDEIYFAMNINGKEVEFDVSYSKPKAMNESVGVFGPAPTQFLSTPSHLL